MVLTEGDQKMLVAVKSFPCEDSLSRKKKRKINKKITRELKFMDRLREIPEFPEIYGVCKNQSGYHIIMEFIGNKEIRQSQTILDEFHKQYNNGFPYTNRRRDIMWMNIFLDIIRGIRKMHEEGIIHCDIAPRNVLLYKNNYKRTAAKVIDLGLACDKEHPRWLSLGRFRRKSTTDQIMDLNSFVAPEFANGTCWSRGGHFSTATDVWSFGNMLDATTPLITVRTKAKLQKLIEGCTVEDPTLRITTEQIQSKLESLILKIQMEYLRCM
ncbi:uncharacterized protein [Antedon mediterranea]|uniref:uncharacterized protein n=1 Tax=Antedon mediterranea TaxID=105859 RepID=UPI003AF5839D